MPGAKTSGPGSAFASRAAASFSFSAGPSSCRPAGSLWLLPEASRTLNGERDETTTRFEPATSSTRTRPSGAPPKVVPG